MNESMFRYQPKLWPVIELPAEPTPSRIAGLDALREVAECVSDLRVLATRLTESRILPGAHPLDDLDVQTS